MNKNIEQLLTLVAGANEQLIEKHQQLSTTVGLLEQSLQASNAVTVDNIKLKQRLMFIILDANPEIVGVGTGKAGTEDFVFIDQYKLGALSAQVLIELMEQHLLS